jgi:gamma-glutamylcyclotransferase (GGCT)/AIG2-like uncharacterized protein YtfP
METPLHNLFVYGSLRQGFNHAAYDYITQYFELKGMGKAKGRLYDLGEYPAARPATDSFHVVGELYTIKEPDEFEYAIAQLDDYEGVAPEYDQQSWYIREVTDILMDDGQIRQAWIYWYTGDTSGKPEVVSGDVLQYIQSKSSI